MLDVAQTVDGNDAVLHLLDLCRDEVMRGQVNHLCVVICENGQAKSMFSGVAHMEPIAYLGAGLLQKSLLEACQNRALPKNENGAANRMVFNLAKMPFCFDFVGPLVDAEMTRVRQGLEGPLRVAWHHGNSDITQVVNTKQRERNFNGIMRPLVYLIGGVEDQTALQDGRYTDHCSLQPVVQACRQGEAVPKFAAPEKYRNAIDAFVHELGDKPPITITLREAQHTPHRNSNIPEWLKLAEWLESQGEQVIFVRDTDKSREPLDGTITCHAAAENLLLRCALYQSAKANLFVSNGPAMLAVFGDKPWLIFNEVQEDGNYAANTSEGWLRCSGISPGEQWPWSKPNQKIIWQRDQFKIMRDAYLEHIAT